MSPMTPERLRTDGERQASHHAQRARPENIATVHVHALHAPPQDAARGPADAAQQMRGSQRHTSLPAETLGKKPPHIVSAAEEHTHREMEHASWWSEGTTQSRPSEAHAHRAHHVHAHGHALDAPPQDGARVSAVSPMRERVVCSEVADVTLLPKHRVPEVSSSCGL